MIRINLLPVRAAQKKEELRGQLAILIVAVVVALLGCGGVYASLFVKVSTVKDEISRKEAELSRLKKTLGEVTHFKKLQEELRGKLEVLDKLKEGKAGPVHLLDELSQVLPDKLWVDAFNEKGGVVSLSGFGLNEATVAEFLRRLEASPYYKAVELQVIEQSTKSGVKLQKFKISCQTETPANKLQVK